MGGMQTFEWVVAYPDFMDKAVPIVGSPRLAPFDLLHWQAQIDAIMADRGWNNGDYTANPAREAEYEFGAILLTTPDEVNRRLTRQNVLEQIEKGKKAPSPDANNKIRQVQAMMALDVSTHFDGSMPRAAAAVKAKVLVIVAKLDHTVTPGPALEVARLLGAKTIELESDCGHLATSCEGKKVAAAVADFLEH